VKIYHENPGFVKLGPTSILTIFVTCQASSQTMSTVHTRLCMYILYVYYMGINNVCISVISAFVSATKWTLWLHTALCNTCIYMLVGKRAVCSDGRATDTLRGCCRVSQRADRCVFVRRFAQS